MSQDRDDPGDIRTLGVLESLREVLASFQSSNGDLYWRLDRVLRHLADPNLHDIGLNHGFRIEVWDRYGKDHLRMCIAATSSIAIAHAGFEVALEQYPHDRLTLRNGLMLMRDSERERRR
jgi:hypothetical protein